MAKLTRYKNNIAPDGISIEAQEKLMASKVLVAGAGGLGSNVIMNLVSLGIGQIKIIDGDIVKEEELNRQFIHKYKNIGRAKVISAKDWIQEFNTDIKVELDKIKLNEINYFNNILNYDIIVDCFNDDESKYMLNEIAIRHNKILVHGSSKGFYGQVTTILPKKTGCLNCVMQKPIQFKKEEHSTLPTTTSIIASLQAQEVLKIISGVGEPLFNKLMMYDGINGEFKILNYSKNIACETCFERGYANEL